MRHTGHNRRITNAEYYIDSRHQGVHVGMFPGLAAFSSLCRSYNSSLLQLFFFQSMLPEHEKHRNMLDRFKIKTAPSHYPQFLFRVLQALQLICSITVAVIMIWFI